MPKMYIIWTIIGHRFGPQLGLDESSGRKLDYFSAWNCVLRLVGVFPNSTKHKHICKQFAELTFLKRACCFSKAKTSACGKPDTPWVGLGVTNTYKNHININKYVIHLDYYLLVYPVGINKSIVQPNPSIYCFCCSMDNFVLTRSFRWALRCGGWRKLDAVAML